jgi:5,10-methylene-tetrahydrofolate dehydrogenase/methenyl tetrahydrofolate cyclohydrolase
VESLKAATGKVPGLAVVLVGSRKDSQTYVRSKKKACAEVGIKSFDADLPEDVSEEDLLKIVTDFNANPDVHGILIQLPLPKHINEERVLGAVSVEKDVDGFHPVNVGTLAMQQRDPLFVACTPAGCIELLQRTGVQIAGKYAVVLGRSKTVGMPAAMLLQRLNATVTVIHSRTPNPAEHTRRADIVIAAIGKAVRQGGLAEKRRCRH